MIIAGFLVRDRERGRIEIYGVDIITLRMREDVYNILLSRHFNEWRRAWMGQWPRHSLIGTAIRGAVDWESSGNRNKDWGTLKVCRAVVNN